MNMNMHTLKPENVLKRSEEYVGVGKKDQALRLMFDMLSNRRNRTWQQTHEKVMLRYLELCVENKNNRMAKEGLHQYRNLSLQQAPNSLEKVIEYMLSAAMTRTKQAATECNAKAITKEVEDLENDKTPESILLETVTADRTKERTEREVLVPWLKFLWESFRTVLEILRNNSKLQHVYHETAHRAFVFCKEYQRNTEFRRLCEILRNHMNPNNKYGQDKELILTSETMELHLATRFEQLKVASSLRIWHEGFRTIEDIHHIMTISNKRPSSQLMATYYLKLTQLFLISENFLFHAYAYKAYYYLSREKNKSLTKQQSMIMSSSVLLAAMSIPLQNSKAGRTITEEGMQKEKNRRMAQLLGFDINPKRNSILKELLSQGILDVVFPEVRDIYLLLEDAFTPLDLVSKATPVFAFLRKQDRLKSYIKPLEKLLVVRLVGQLGTIYYSVKLDYFQELLKDLDMPYLEIEKTVIKALKARQVNVHHARVDHRAGCIRFGEDVMEEDRTRKLLSEMTTGLQGVCKDLEPVDAEEKREIEKAHLVQSVLNEVNRQHESILARKVLIEKRKEEYERIQAEKQRVEQLKKIELENERQQAEQMRLDKQRERREKEKADALRDEEKLFEIRQQMMQEGVDLKGTDIVNMSKDERENLIEETRKKAEKANLETERKIQALAKKLDTTVRALREVERPKLEIECEKQLEQDKKAFEQAWTEQLKSGEVNHKKGLETKARFRKIDPYLQAFETPLIDAWKAECDKEQQQHVQSIQTQQRMAKLQRARRRRTEALKVKKKEEEEMRRRRAEEERVAREVELQRIREEEEEKQRLEREEIEREREALRKEREQRENARREAERPIRRENPSSEGSWKREARPAPSSGGGGGGEWRRGVAKFDDKAGEAFGRSDRRGDDKAEAFGRSDRRGDDRRGDDRRGGDRGQSDNADNWRRGGPPREREEPGKKELFKKKGEADSSNSWRRR